ncbi:MAG: aminotransferase DegT [Planctomycetes bacterium RBG_13_60_9]|nr:MAG: aminotransferase DegT [Planctomycetes bacterium RBG_13_60_9]
MRKIPLTKPYMDQWIKDKVCEVLDSGYLTEGPVTKQFEESFRDYVGSRHAIAVTSCTTGLEMALRALHIGPGDEVIVPDYTYPATADAVAIVGASPVIVDVARDTMLIDYDAIERAITGRTRAVVPVSGFGNPLDYDRLRRIKDTYGLFVVEDAACSIGAEYKGRKVGTQADISIFSLHPRKFITTGEGGVITTHNAEWAAWMESYKHFGMSISACREGTVFERIGTNYKLSNILAAVGLGQMRKIDELLTRRRSLAGNYMALLEGCDKVAIPAVTPDGVHSFQSFCVFVDDRDKVLRGMRAEGIEVQIGTYALHMHPAFKDCTIRKPLEGSRYAWEHCLALPLYHELTREDQEYVVEHLCGLL